VGLLYFGCPADIECPAVRGAFFALSAAVSAVIVDAVDGQIGRGTFSEVREKRREGFSPAQTDDDAPVPVILVGPWIGRAGATAFHRQPEVVLSRALTGFTASMLQLGAVPASARSAVFHGPGKNSRFPAACAATDEAGLAAVRFTRGKHRPAPEGLAGEVLKAG
jgi:hypothetical protein